ncbi:hypothetical protein CC78DRAFT_552221 [Lojkania enalia]|uniref:FAM192A/Fyv6 N-terminal domain-containing protein n=1 Tax=Lojkania enalia TaxID=147567 RepID=A0A9P4N7M3_9PLEO|nr:hypothetical protein CC78DRAFT_552221 [Didymosphaeria enalia]
MSSGFVSGGTVDNPAERDDEWRAAQAELDEQRRRKEEAGQQDGGKSLYEVLQANKAAKQEAFEEATRLKNQYRALDDDEAEFLDSVLEQTRKQEAAVRKETLEQLDLFRKHQEEAERLVLMEQDGSPGKEDTKQWIASGRKRKKGVDAGLLKGIKLRKSSSTGESQADAKKAVGKDGKMVQEKGEKEDISEQDHAKADQAPATAALSPKRRVSAKSPPPQKAKTIALNLGYLSSDEDD